MTDDMTNPSATPRRKRRCATLLLVCVLNMPAAGPAQAAADDMFSVMFQMMLVMMNVMSDAMLGNSALGSNWGGLNSFGAGMGAWPAMSGLASPWSGLGSPWAGGWNSPFGTGAGPWSGYAPQRPGNALLEGRWYGNSGEILVIRGNRFRLQKGVIVLSGTLRIANNLIVMYSPQTRTATRYTFARNQTDLLLTDGSGTVLNFRRHPRDLRRRPF